MDFNDPAVLGGIALIVVTTLFLLFRMTSGPSKKKFLNKTRQEVVLGERFQLSHDTVKFRFLLPKSAPVLGLPVGLHIKLFSPNMKGVKAGEWNGKEDPEDGESEIERKYTPCSSDDEVGYVDFVIKVYKGGVIDRFPDGGKMSQYLDTLKVGDKLSIMGPVGTHTYMGKGVFKSGKKEHQCKKLGMMAGGTGITPMLQVIAAVLKDPSDPTIISLIYANQSEDDILVRDMLEAHQQAHPKRFKLHYTVDRPPPNWKYSTGFITDEMIKEHIGAPEAGSLVLMCGPPPMVRFACQANLDKLGYKKDVQIAF